MILYLLVTCGPTDTHSVLQPPCKGEKSSTSMQSLRSFLIVFSLELLLRAAFLLKSAFHCFILLLGIKFSSESESDEWPCKGPGRSRTGIRSLIRLGEERRGEESRCCPQSSWSCCVFITPLRACCSDLSYDFRYLKKTSHLKGHRELCCGLSKHTGSRLYVGSPLAMHVLG